MRRWMLCLVCLALMGAALPALAINPGTDILVPAAAKGGSWLTDLYIMNAGDTAVDGTVYWLVRGTANPAPVGVPFTLFAGETMVMADVIGNDFGLAEGAGAFRVVASGEVVVNSRIYSVSGDATLGQGFAGIPAALATPDGGQTVVVGLSSNDTFRSNFYALSGANGAALAISLVSSDGSLLDQATLTLSGAYHPDLQNVTTLFGADLADFDDASLVVELTNGAAVVGASKVDNASGDPTTLESSVPVGAAGSIDGSYQISIYDEDTYAAGGNLVIRNGVVEIINGTYMNFQKDEDDDGYSDCLYIFLWGIGLPQDLAVSAFADGEEFTDSYATTGSGDLTWTLQFTMDGTQGLSGTLDAMGSNFPASSDPFLDESGCNGVYPQLTVVGGKLN